MLPILNALIKKGYSIAANLPSVWGSPSVDNFTRTVVTDVGDGVLQVRILLKDSDNKVSTTIRHEGPGEHDWYFDSKIYDQHDLTQTIMQAAKKGGVKPQNMEVFQNHITFNTPYPKGLEIPSKYKLYRR